MIASSCLVLIIGTYVHNTLIIPFYHLDVLLLDRVTCHSDLASVTESCQIDAAEATWPPQATNIVPSQLKNPLHRSQHFIKEHPKLKAKALRYVVGVRSTLESLWDVLCSSHLGRIELMDHIKRRRCLKHDKSKERYNSKEFKLQTVKVVQTINSQPQWSKIMKFLMKGQVS